MSDPWVLAIDFGTSYTVAAARRAGRAPEVIEIDGERRVPSVILIDHSGEIVVGRAAEALAPSQPDRALRTPKYRLGIPTSVVLGGRPYSIIDLVAALLRYVYDEAVIAQGGPPTEVRLTYPASWSAPRRDELLTAATTAGLPNPTLVPEPVAAAISYTDDSGLQPGSHVLVYDLGGGTFDTAALRADDPGFVVIGRPTGDANLGGELFDELVTNHLGEQLDRATWDKLQASDEVLWQLAAAGLRNESRRAKEVLSSHPEADVLLGLPTGIVNAHITRSELETLIRPYITESIDVMRRCATDAGLRAEDLDAVYIVGGASRSPLVRDMVGAVFPQAQVSRRGDPKSAVALGATHPGIDIHRLEHRITHPGNTTTEHAPPTEPPVAPPPTVPLTPSSAPAVPIAPAAGTVIEQPPPRTPPPTAPPTAPTVAAGTVIEQPPPAPTRTFRTVPAPAGTDSSAPNRKKLALIGAGIAAAIAVIAIVAVVTSGGGGNSTAVPSTTSTPASATTSIAPTTTPAPSTTLGLAPGLTTSIVDGQELTIEDVPASGFPITGTTDRGATLTINGVAVTVDADGAWKHVITGLKIGENPLTIAARRAGAAPTDRRIVLRGISRPTTTPPPPIETTVPPTTRPPSFARAVDDVLTGTFNGAGAPVTLAGSALSNDSGSGGLSASIVSQPSQGSASISATGVVVYTPTRNGTFTTTFRYRACLSGSSVCGDATITVRILCNVNFPGCT